MIIKKTVAVLLSVLLITAGLTLTASAYEDGELIVSESLTPRLYDSPADMTGSVEIIESLVDTDEFREYLLGEFLECKTTIPVSQFNIPVSASEYASDFIWYHMPEAFGVYSLSYSFYSYSGNIINLVVEYCDFTDTPAEYKACMEAFYEKADKLLSGIEGNSSLSETEKALLLHDRLAVNTEYDFTGTNRVIHTAYGAFANKLAVCQGYAMAYMYLLQRVGIENYYCSSQALNHGWNIVYIGGKAYHVDVTWDDISYGNGAGTSGRVMHENFLRSTAGIKATGHSANDFDTTPTDTAFDNGFWQSSFTEFVLVGDDIYYLEAPSGSNDASVRNMRTGAVLYSFSEYWMDSQLSAWSGNFSALTKAGDSLLFSISKDVYRLSPASGEAVKLYSPEMPPYYNIFGMTYTDGYIICDINSNPNSDFSLTRVKYEYSAVCSHSETETVTGTPAGCVSPGVTNSVICKNCKTLLSGGTPVPALGHDRIFHQKKSPSCNDIGWNDYYTCSRCDHSTYEELPATGHSEVTDSAVAPSCTETGLTEGKHCSVCNAVTKKQETVPALGHKEVSDPPAEPTCTETGLSEGKHCSVCNAVTKKQETVPALGHKEILHDEKTATCVSVGNKAFVTCERCDYSTFEATAIDENNHLNTENIPETPATTENVGYTAGVYCNDCRKYISGHTELPILEKAFSDSENARAEGSFILINSGLTAKQLLSQARKNAVIKDISGALITDNTLPATGMTLVLPDASVMTLIIMGDTDGDGKISAADARLALRASVGLEKLTDAQKTAAEVDKKAEITASDARLILRASVGLEDSRQWLK
ncbi:MAG: hypothetical protein E7535_00330 [Ruminococcaceae bacterium]|nr:hypothetical protein [Oscillospiraceae bacterium]